MNRSQRSEEPVEREVQRAGGQVSGEELTARSDRRRQHVAHLRPQRVDRDGVLREQAMRADVDDESLGRAIDPRRHDTIVQRDQPRVGFEDPQLRRSRRDLVGWDLHADANTRGDAPALLASLVAAPRGAGRSAGALATAAARATAATP